MGGFWYERTILGLSFWRHPFTAEDPSVSKWRNTKTSSNLFWETRIKLIYILDGLSMSTFSANIHFWMNYSFNSSLCNVFPLESPGISIEDNSKGLYWMYNSVFVFVCHYWSLWIVKFWSHHWPPTLRVQIALWNWFAENRRLCWCIVFEDIPAKTIGVLELPWWHLLY